MSLPLQEPGIGPSPKGTPYAQGCIPLLLPQPDRTPAAVTSFPDASKISSRFEQNLATPWTTGRELAGASHPHTPHQCTGKGSDTRKRGSCTDGHRLSPCKLPRMPPLALPPTAAAARSTAGHLPRIRYFFVCAFPSYLRVLQSTGKHSTSTPQASPRPHLQLHWHLFQLPTNTIYLTPWVQSVSFIINPALP